MANTKIKIPSADELHWRRVEELRKVKMPYPVTMEEALTVLTYDIQGDPEVNPWAREHYGNTKTLNYREARELIKRRVASGEIRKDRVWIRRKKISVLLWPTTQSFPRGKEHARKRATGELHSTPG